MSTEQTKKRKAPPPSKAAKAKDPLIRVDELLKQFKGNRKKTAFTMVAEKYNTVEIGTAFKAATGKGISGRTWGQWKKKSKQTDDSSVMDALEGTTAGAGYLDEFRTMFKQQISTSRELTEVFYDLGLRALLASLKKSGLSLEDFRKLALKTEGGLKAALDSAGETIFKALEYFESDLITKVEAERDEARAYSTVLKSKVNKLLESLDPKFRLEKMIQTYLLSGNVDPDTLDRLIDKWLAMEVTALQQEMLES